MLNYSYVINNPLFLITVPSENSSVSMAYFRFTTISLTQLFGDQVIVSNCIQSLEVLVKKM